MMKEFNQFLWIICFVIAVSCNSATKKSNSNQDKAVTEGTEVNKSQLVSTNDSLISKKKPTYQQLYSESEQRSEIIGNLKHNAATEKKTYNYFLKGDSIKITLYHIKDRIIRIEKRMYDQQNNELGYCMFDFDEENDCFSNTQRDYKEKMSFTNAKYWDELIRFDVHCNIIDMDSSEKHEIIQLTRASLDSIMQHFPEFRYSFNWK